MRVVTATPERLVFRSSRRMGAIIVLLATPAVVWLGLKIVEEGRTSWFGWLYIVVGVLIVPLGIWALSAKEEMVLDRASGLIGVWSDSPLGGWGGSMRLADLGAVELRHRTVYSPAPIVMKYIAFEPRAGSTAKPLRSSQFWTHRRTEQAFGEIRIWLKEAGHPAGDA